jgi:hypothetical protein
VRSISTKCESKATKRKVSEKYKTQTIREAYRALNARHESRRRENRHAVRAYDPHRYRLAMEQGATDDGYIQLVQTGEPMFSV